MSDVYPPGEHIPFCMGPDGGGACVGYLALYTDWLRRIDRIENAGGRQNGNESAGADRSYQHQASERPHRGAGGGAAGIGMNSYVE